MFTRYRRSINVSFRLDALNGERLKALAAQGEVSHHQYARGFVLEVLTGVDQMECLDRRLQATDDQIRGLRRDLGAALLAILANIKDGVTEEAVRDWLRRNGLIVT